MEIRKVLSSLAVVALLSTTACAATETRESTGEQIDSTVISTKVRAAIAADDQLSIFPIDVTTFRGTVQLSGFVNSVEEKRRAESVASNVEGVSAVKNDLIIKNTSR